MSAVSAFYFKIHSHPQKQKFLTAARMRFFHFQNISYMNVHCITLFNFNTIRIVSEAPYCDMTGKNYICIITKFKVINEREFIYE